MMKNTFNKVLSPLFILAVLSTSCGPKAFVRGEYDDPTRVELLDDRFNEADMQQISDTVVRAMVACKWVANAPKPPIVAVERVQNRTEEHIDMLSLTEKIQTALIKSGKVRFVDKAGREAIEKEIQYQESGAVWGPSAKKRGQQLGVDYLFGGALATNIQQVGNEKYIYYKLTANLTNLETSTIDCVEEKEIRKKYRKQAVTP